MFKALEPFAFLMTTATIGLILLVFRGEVRKLTDWVVGFKRIEKTEKGYAVDASGKPDAPLLASEKQEQAIAAVEAVEIVSEVPKSVASETWIDAMFDDRFEDAIQLLESDIVATGDPERRLTPQSVIGYVKFQQKASEGVEYFEALIDEHPKRLQPYQWYALTYLWNDLPAKALAVLDRGLGVVQNKAILLDTKSDCLVRLGREDEALAAAAEGVTADPTLAANYLNLSKISEKRGQVYVASAWLERGIDATLGAMTLLEAYGRFLNAHGTPAQAIDCYRAIVARQPNNFTNLTLLGNAYLSAGFNSLALDIYMRADELAHGEAGWILSNIGNILNNRGFYAEACKYLKRAVEREPDSQYAHERLAQAQKAEATERETMTALLEAARAGMNTQQQPQLPDSPNGSQ